LTTRRVEIGPVARGDLKNLILWLRVEADAEVAKRFAASAVLTLGKLAEAPGLGPPIRTGAAGLNGVRKWRVEGFPKILIFYQPLGDGVRIVRILHAAADWWSLLDVN
jgi:toxin ParE1/3/4